MDGGAEGSMACCLPKPQRGGRAQGIHGSGKSAQWLEARATQWKESLTGSNLLCDLE